MPPSVFSFHPKQSSHQHMKTNKAVLAIDGHEVILEKIEDWNVVELMVNEEVVFHCNIKDLEFGGDGKLDPLCEKARIAVLNAY
ncbi:UPF0728 protein C10orf53 homolog isoform X3 [Pan paniscus]|uniref:UPF0728 protein C10orf53 homolog isoform X3 n=1 Tax=Pan paniscus TaxID=9597 RepID=UPI0007DBEE35|nr:UPF0728 protein C10orf53 homolog isoform X2 [Pan troglodytes]XP_054515530.1 UPF0728 protein C10orf53 homolog isoform X2 [Pan troglodytes]XP_054515531.1 UPF0728 protein C10orf53 homolog isoform X2 [Pan troglodytes]XP_054948759.1 UPF0728 protein C10orf53 homolog isoform X3 [Pan paniscus]XP_054948760.1 UPF0728 protein C10orf53 homolog isoform X3 [Pan paniscus]